MMENLIKKKKVNIEELIKESLKDYIEKYLAFQSADIECVCCDNLINKPILGIKRDKARVEWQQASNRYHELLLLRKGSIFNN